MADTLFTSLHDSMRALLGDRQVHGNWHYATDTLNAGLRTALLTGRGPDGYGLVGADPFAAVALTPALEIGADAAILLYEACLVLVAGEDGALSYVTRSLSVRDGGDRKRDLMRRIEMLLHEMRDGSFAFSSFQTIAQYLAAFPAGEGSWLDHAAQLGGITVQPAIGDITI